jgi:predicted esterase
VAREAAAAAATPAAIPSHPRATAAWRNPTTGRSAIATCTGEPLHQVPRDLAGDQRSRRPRLQDHERKHPAFDDGAPLIVQASTAPSAASTRPAQAALPLLIYFHGSGGGAENVYTPRSCARGGELRSQQRRPKKGFVLLSIRRETCTGGDRPGRVEARHLLPGLRHLLDQPDFANADAFIDELVKSRSIKRVFVTGWSNGGVAQSYAAARHQAPSPAAIAWRPLPSTRR